MNVRLIPPDLEGGPGARCGPKATTSNLLMVHAWSPFGKISFNYASWSISAELLVCLIFLLLLFLVVLSGLVAVAIMLITAGFVREAFKGKSLPELTWSLGAMRAVPSFMLGVWLWVHRARLSEAACVRKFARVMFVISGAAIVALILIFPNDYAILAWVYILVASGFMCDVLGFKTIASWKPISSRGYLTYSIYMIHTVVSTVVLSFVFPHFFSQISVVRLSRCDLRLDRNLSARPVVYWRFEKPARDRINSIGKARRVDAAIS